LFDIYNVLHLQLQLNGFAPHVSGERFVDDARSGLLGATEGQVKRVNEPRQEVDGVALKTNENKL
jgi:hypothetical protein